MSLIQAQCTPASAASAQQFLAFTLGGEEYGVAIEHVQELRSYEAVTHLANAPDYLKGVTNLRGIIVPIVDLRIKLGIGTPTYHALTVVIILHLGTRIVGAVVDSVSDVSTFDSAQIKPPPGLAAHQADYLLGLGAQDGRMLQLVDIERLLAAPLPLLDTALAA